METFLAVYTGSAESRERSGWDDLDAEQLREREERGRRAWGDWMASNEASIVYVGGPLGRTKRVSRDGVGDTRNNLAAFVVVQAPSLDAAAALFEHHPHFSIFPGDAVEVMPCLAIPGA